MKRLLMSSAALMLAAAAYAPHAQAETQVEKYLGADPVEFGEVNEAVEAFKTELAAKNVPGLAKLLGLNPDEIGKSDQFDEKLDELKNAAAEQLKVAEDGDDGRVLLLGGLVWPFPFPLVKADGKWAFDTVAGLEEILDRRIGENELEAIDTARNYLEAQEIYFSEDWDADGVQEYAQVLKSPEGTKDGLFWPTSADGIESPAGGFVVESKAEAAKDSQDGYYGYRYRILTKQGENIAGGAYDYVINGNMIAGFALIATPARYGETGIKTFMVSHHGKVYQKDLGPESEAEAAKITDFNPDKSWEAVPD